MTFEFVLRFTDDPLCLKIASKSISCPTKPRFGSMKPLFCLTSDIASANDRDFFHMRYPITTHADREFPFRNVK
jgi:hypothetical protein